LVWSGSHLLLDTGVFDDDRYWVVEVHYAKAGPEDLLMTVEATNAGPEADVLHVLPTAWYRNTWSWEVGAAPDTLAATGPTTVGIPHPFLGLFYDQLAVADGRVVPVAVRSMVGIIPMLAAGVVNEELLDRTQAAGNHFADFLDRAGLRDRDQLLKLGLLRGEPGHRQLLLGVVGVDRLERLFEKLRFFGDDYTVEYPTGSGRTLPLDAIARDLWDRLIAIFLVDAEGRRPCFGWVDRFQRDPRWKDNVAFFEYFHADNGAGLGASHQTGWTGLVADIIRRRHGGVTSLGDVLRALRDGKDLR
jgi:hypothetical protein